MSKLLCRSCLFCSWCLFRSCLCRSCLCRSCLCRSSCVGAVVSELLCRSCCVGTVVSELLCRSCASEFLCRTVASELLCRSVYVESIAIVGVGAVTMSVLLCWCSSCRHRCCSCPCWCYGCRRRYSNSCQLVVLDLLVSEPSKLLCRSYCVGAIVSELFVLEQSLSSVLAVLELPSLGLAASELSVLEWWATLLVGAVACWSRCLLMSELSVSELSVSELFCRSCCVVAELFCRVGAVASELSRRSCCVGSVALERCVGAVAVGAGCWSCL